MDFVEDRTLPPDFLLGLRELEETYLAYDDPIRQSGFSGGSERWRIEREPILEAIHNNGEVLDVCCANGYLLECLIVWGKARGLNLVPFGVDQGPRLIELAKRRLPHFSSNFQVANAWAWCPPRRYQYVYALCDCVPQSYLSEFVRRLLKRVVAPHGRLILGAYGNRSRKMEPLSVDEFLNSNGHAVAGAATAGNPPLARFAWIDQVKA